MTYTFFGGFVFIQFFMLAIGLVGSRLFAKIARISDAILIPSIFVLCVVGSFAINNNFFDVVVMFLFGIVGYIMRKVNMNTAAVVLALILGPLGGSAGCAGASPFLAATSVSFSQRPSAKCSLH